MAGGARPDPFRTRKLSRRAPMVLRGQPVGEQGAADRWTALDPFRAGRGGAAGDSLRGAPFFFLHIVQPRAPWGPFPMPRGAAIVGRTESSISTAGAGRRLPRGAPPSPGAVLAGKGALAPPGAEGPCPRTRGLAAACRSGRPARSRGRRPGVRPVRWPFRSARAVSPASRASLSAGPRPRRPGRAPGRVLRARWGAVSVNLFFTSSANQTRRSRKGGFTACANVFSPIPVTP